MMAGFETLFYKEVLRFWTVVTQTICAPIMIATMYLLIFVHTLKEIGLGIFVITAWFANLSFVALLSTMEVDRRYLGRQVRAVGGPPEFPDHARDFPRRRILFHSLVAAVLVSYFVSESVLLYD